MRYAIPAGVAASCLAAALLAPPAHATVHRTSCAVHADADVSAGPATVHVHVFADPGAKSGTVDEEDVSAGVAGGPTLRTWGVDRRPPGPGTVEQLTGVDVLGIACP
jgi:hypothetical protein